MKKEVIFFDSNGNITDEKSKAVKVVIRELDDNGNLVNETFLRQPINDENDR